MSKYKAYFPVHSLSEAHGLHDIEDVREAMMIGVWPRKKLPFEKKIQALSDGSISWDEFENSSSYSVTFPASFDIQQTSVDSSNRIAVFSPSDLIQGTDYTFFITSNTNEKYRFYMHKITYSGSPYALSMFEGQTVRISLFGAAGGAATASAVGEKGGRSIATLEITPSSYVYIGGKGGNSCRNTYTTLTCADDSGTGVGGWNGGAPGGSNGGAYQGPGGGGGGATDLRIGGTALSSRVSIAGGGGGYTQILEKGLGGGSSGTQGHSVGASRAMGGMPGTQSAGGAGGAEPGYSGGDGSSGTPGVGGNGGNCPHSWCMGGGGGGGGYYGGGGGESGDTSLNNTSAGGGGGSGFFDPNLVDDGSTEAGVGSSSHGFAIIVYGVVQV